MILLYYPAPPQMSIVTGATPTVYDDKYSFGAITPVYDSYYSKVTGATYVVSQWACELDVAVGAGSAPISAGFRLVVPAALRSNNFVNTFQLSGHAAFHDGTDVVVYGFLRSVAGEKTMWVEFASIPTKVVEYHAKVRVSAIVLGT